MDGYELVQASPVKVYRKIFPNMQENQTKNEYYADNGVGVLSLKFDSVEEATKAILDSRK